MTLLQKSGVEQEILFQRFKLLLIIRTLFVTLLLAIIAFLNFKKLPELSFPILSIYGLIIFAYIFNIASAIAIKKITVQGWFIGVELLMDALFITMLIYVTGGSNSLLSFLYIFLILEGGYIYFRKGAFYSTALSIIFYGAALEFEFYGITPYMSLIREESPIKNSFQLLSLISYNFIAYIFAGILWGVLSEQFRRAHRSLKTLEDMTKIVFRKIPSGLMTVTRDGYITSFNNSAETITGMPSESVLGQRIMDVFPELRIDNPRPLRNECIMKKPDGKEIIVGYSIGDLGDEGMVIIFQDLTREKQMEEEVKRSERLASLGRLSAGLAHEMRTIVASISASAQLLKSTEANKDEWNNLTRIIINESKRLNEIVTNFLNFSKPERNMSELLDINQIIHDTIEAFEKNNKKKIKIKTIFNAGTKKIRGSREGMRQVFSNILLNAEEAMKDGGEITIKVGMSPDNQNMIDVTISDTGCGIPPDVLPHIFEPFFTTKENGAGLGLATVYRIVEAHRGKINVTSTVGKGTEFRITLPAEGVN